MIFWELFITFFVIGMFTIGGGYAMLSLIQNEVVTVHGWIDDGTFTDIVAISQMTPGPIGINLGMLRNKYEYTDNVSACSLCCSCDNVCPAKVNLSEQIYLWRQQLDSLGKANEMKKIMSMGMKLVFDNPCLYNTALKFAPLVNNAPRFAVYNSLNAWGKGRELPVFAKESFQTMWKKGKVK